jgi:hypothetical protein
VSLSNENASVVDGASQSHLEDLGLESSLKEILDFEGKDVIELVLVLVQHSNSVQTSHESSTFEKSLGILFIKSEELSSSLSDSGHGLLNSPHFSLVLQTKLSDKLELLVKTFLLKWSSGSFGSLAVCGGEGEKKERRISTRNFLTKERADEERRGKKKKEPQ